MDRNQLTLGENIFVGILLILSLLTVNYLASPFQLSSQNYQAEPQKQPSEKDVQLFDNFTAFVEKNQDILASLQSNEHFSAHSAMKIKNFFQSNNHFRKVILSNLKSHPQSPKCIEKLNKAQGRKLVSLIIDHIDFSLNFNLVESSLKGPKILQYMDESVNRDQHLKKSTKKCFQKLKNLIMNKSLIDMMTPNQSS